MNKIIVIMCVTILIIFLGAITLTNNTSRTSYKQSTTPQATSTPSNTITSTTTVQYSLADIALHATPNDCWVAIDSGVYNFTDYVQKHPGGARAVTKLCGTDGTRQYNSEHGGQKQPAETLLLHKIGTLK